MGLRAPPSGQPGQLTYMSRLGVKVGGHGNPQGRGVIMTGVMARDGHCVGWQDSMEMSPAIE